MHFFLQLTPWKSIRRRLLGAYNMYKIWSFSNCMIACLCQEIICCCVNLYLMYFFFQNVRMLRHDALMMFIATALNNNLQLFLTKYIKPNGSKDHHFGTRSHAYMHQVNKLNHNTMYICLEIRWKLKTISKQWHKFDKNRYQDET